MARCGFGAYAFHPIAVVGMGCRFPGAPDVHAYWRVIRDGIDATGEIPASRWDVAEFFDSTGQAPGKMSTRWGGFLDDVLGCLVPSASTQTIFQAALGPGTPPYLAHHCVDGSPVVPAAGYLEQALAAADQVFGKGDHIVENVAIQQAMILANGQSRTVHFLSEHLQVSADTIDITAPFETFGIDSLAAIGVTGELEDWLGRTVDPMIVYNYPSVEEMAKNLAADRQSS